MNGPSDAGTPERPRGGTRIRPLASTLANQIAAGEVVERPASVLKELLENSVDAGAARVRVDAGRGGLTLLRVSDDGTGIHVDDLALALERHATSKIATLDELEAVASMGFRGEALPSIASVSRLRIESRAAGADAGWAVSAEGGPVDGAPVPAAHPPGTTVTVKDLFFNTPVRRRFLRTPRTELRHLDRVFRRQALATFEVAMTLCHDGRELLRVPAAGDPAARRRRVGRLLGSRFADTASEVDRCAAGMRLWGWLGAADLARERSDLQHLFVNGRPVADATVRHAVRLAYGSLLADGAQPAWLLYLELDPREVDVNVHPAKHEVRFREARTVHDFVRSVVRGAVAHEVRGDGAGGARRPGLPARQGADAMGPGAMGNRAAGEGRETYGGAAGPASGRGGDADGALRLLALLPGDLVVAARGEQALLARGPDLRRADVLRVLGRVDAASPPVSRPLLIPERLPFGSGDGRDDAVLGSLAALGFELRVSGPGRALLLAVPEVLARVPAADLARTLGESLAGSASTGGPADTLVAALGELAGSTPLAGPDEAERLLRTLGREPCGTPWLSVDAGSLERLLRPRGEQSPITRR